MSCVSMAAVKKKKKRLEHCIVSLKGKKSNL